MDAILSKQRYRRTFYVIVALIFLLAITARFFVLPYFAAGMRISLVELLGTLLDNLVVSLFLAVFIGAFVFWLTPSVMKRSAMEVIEPKEINPLLKSATSTTRSWVYKGACGRYTRAVTLPKLADAARVEGLGRDITICVLNPQNEDVCAEYATYRRSLKSNESSHQWTTASVREEIIATAVAAMKFRVAEPLLRIRVFFVDHFSAFRLDISDSFVVVTKEDKGAAALRADSGTYFYNSHKDDVRLTERQSREMKYHERMPVDRPVDGDILNAVVTETGIVEASVLGTLNIERLLSSINTPKDPY